MSKYFKSQSHFRYKKLGKRWRKPKGRHSKMRVRKRGKARRVAIGHGSAKITRGFIRGLRVVYINNIKDLENVGKNDAALISSRIGLKKLKIISDEAKKKNIRIFNAKRIKKIGKREKEIAEKQKTKKEKKKESKKEAKDRAKKTKEDKKEEKKEAAKENITKPEEKINEHISDADKENNQTADIKGGS